MFSQSTIISIENEFVPFGVSPVLGGLMEKTQTCAEMFEFNENNACLKFNLYCIFTTHKYTFHKNNVTNFPCKARVTTSIRNKMPVCMLFVVPH